MISDKAMIFQCLLAKYANENADINTYAIEDLVNEYGADLSEIAQIQDAVSAEKLGITYPERS